jgi:hypothetical protein
MNDLSNIENYKKVLFDNSNVIFLNYIGLLYKIFYNFEENVKNKNKEYFKYLLHKCIANTKHIFLTLLLYTKNLELTNYHTEKSIFYFIEFISQIDNDNNLHLNLNSKDATLFIYKKTIYEINESYRKKYKADFLISRKMYAITQLIELYNDYLFTMLFDKDVVNSINNVCNIIVNNNVGDIDDHEKDNDMDDNEYSEFKNLYLNIMNKLHLLIENLLLLLEENDENNRIMLTKIIEIINILKKKALIYKFDDLTVIISIIKKIHKKVNIDMLNNMIVAIKDIKTGNEKKIIKTAITIAK